MELEIVGYSPSLKPQVVDLVTRVLGESRAVNNAYLDWKYAQNPYIDDVILHLALAGGRVAGMRGIYGTRWRFGPTTERTIPAAADLAVDPDHRGRWIPHRLISASNRDLSDRGHEYVFATSAGPTTRFLRIEAGCKRVATYQAFRRGIFSNPEGRRRPATHDAPSFSRRVIRRARREIRDRKTQTTFRRLDEWAATQGGPITVTTSPPVSVLSDLASRYGDPSRFQQVRDEDFYRWRLRNPRSHYWVVVHEEMGKPDGFLIIQQAVSGGTVSIMDWATSTTDVWAKLLGAVVDSKLDPLEIISTSFTADQVESLHRAGFELALEPDTRLHPAAGILVESLTSRDDRNWTVDGQQLLDPERWDMRMIYADVA